MGRYNSPRPSSCGIELWVDPPRHAVVLSVNERSQIQMLDLSAARAKTAVALAIAPTAPDNRLQPRPWPDAYDKSGGQHAPRGPSNLLVEAERGAGRPATSLLQGADAEVLACIRP